MNHFEYVVVLVTVSSDEEAGKITNELLEKRKAACINIIPSVISQFWWDGRIDRSDELLLLIKTRLSAVPELVQIIKGLHSYTVPEIVVLPIIQGNEDYLRWIEREVRA